MGSKVCSSCGHRNLEEHQYCTQCGKRLLQRNGQTPRLVILVGEHEQMAFPIIGKRTTIGRDKFNKIILNDTQVSKIHAEILYEDQEYWIHDLNSKNGVFINGKKVIGKHRLLPGFLIKMGSTILRFEMPENGK